MEQLNKKNEGKLIAFIKNFDNVEKAFLSQKWLSAMDKLDVEVFQRSQKGGNKYVFISYSISKEKVVLDISAFRTTAKNVDMDNWVTQSKLEKLLEDDTNSFLVEAKPNTRILDTTLKKIDKLLARTIED